MNNPSQKKQTRTRAAGKTNQKRYEEALQHKDEALTALLNNIPDMAWLKDLQSRFIAVNEPYGKACGFKPDELIGKTDLDIWPRELALYYRKFDRDVMRTRQRITIEEPLMDQHGRIAWIEAIKTPIIDAKGRVTGLAGIARDITQRKALTEKLRLGEETVRRAMQEREALVRDLHDQTIQSLYALGLELELDGHLMPPSARRARAQLRKSVNELNTIIRDLRSFITDSRTTPPPVIRLKQEIRAFLDRIRKTRAVQVYTRLDTEACNLLGPFQSAHVLNIVREAVSNSLKHAHARKIIVSICRRQREIVIRIQDDGVGMRKMRGNSRGLGLSNIYSRVAEMSGRVQIRSRKKGGTTVFIALGEGGDHA
jgi:two-component system sensor histidine kinase UhpB